MRYTPEGLRQDVSETDDGGSGRPPSSSSQDRAVPARPERFGLLGWLRWAWRQLTSMRVALILLLLLAAAALPGAFFPQRPRDPEAVRAYEVANPDLSPFLDALGIFDVYGSAWFSAIYLLLFTSLIGCIVPRSWAHLQAMRAGPTRVPRRFTRFPVRAQTQLDGAGVEGAAVEVRSALRRGYRRNEQSTPDGDVEISAERGYGRETGNIVFHLALVGLLITMAWGQLVYYRGQVVVIEGGSMVNSAVDYDSFFRGVWFDHDSQDPFQLRLESFSASFTTSARADDFVATVDLTQSDGEVSRHEIRVNDPLTVGSARVYLTGNGYAADLTIRDADEEIAFSGPVLFLPQDALYNSTGVVWVPDANRGELQMAFSGDLFPTAWEDADGVIQGSAFPLPGNPVVVLNGWTGDLGLDSGVPRNLFVLDTSDLDPMVVQDEDGELVPMQLVMAPGETLDLPDDLGSITFSEVRRYAALDVRWDPSVPWMGLFATLAFLGLTGSLFLPRRRIWVRITQEAGSTVVSAAALARGDDPGLQRELDRVMDSVTPTRAPERETGTENGDG